MASRESNQEESPFFAGDLWPVGSFGWRDSRALIPVIFKSFDIPCWPELTSLGPREELIGFWKELFLLWQKDPSPERLTQTLLARPGIQALNEFLHTQAQPLLPILKGQMIGPSTLLWSLKSEAVAHQDEILSFLAQAFKVQADFLNRLSKVVIISLDEPCAFLMSETLRYWEELLSKIRYGQDHNAMIALHSCGTPQPTWLDLEWDVVHLDYFELSQAMNSKPDPWTAKWGKYFGEKRWLALGMISSSPMTIFDSERDILSELREMIPPLIPQQMLLSTSCGLAQRTENDLQPILNRLTQLQTEFQREFL